MVAEEYKIESLRKNQRPAGKTTISVVDQWHKEWSKVLAAMERAGNRKILMLDKDGWLSARQSVVAAFVDDQVIGHLIFHVEPVVSDHGGIELEARVDTVSVVAPAQEAELVRLLVGVAEPHARTILQCRSFKWGSADCDA